MVAMAIGGGGRAKYRALSGRLAKGSKKRCFFGDSGTQSLFARFKLRTLDGAAVRYADVGFFAKS
jgi:hypothetical protein